MEIIQNSYADTLKQVLKGVLQSKSLNSRKAGCNIIFISKEFLTSISDVAAFVRDDLQTALSITFVSEIEEENGFSNSHIVQVLDYMLRVYQYQQARDLLFSIISTGREVMRDSN